MLLRKNESEITSRVMEWTEEGKTQDDLEVCG